MNAPSDLSHGRSWCAVGLGEGVIMPACMAGVCNGWDSGIVAYKYNDFNIEITHGAETSTRIPVGLDRFPCIHDVAKF